MAFESMNLLKKDTAAPTSYGAIDVDQIYQNVHFDDNQSLEAEKKVKENIKINITGVKPKETKNIFLAALLICNFTAQLFQLNIVSFLPQYVNDKFPEINSLEVGALIAVYQITFIIASIWSGINMNRIGRRKTMVIAIQLMGAATAIFGVASYCQSGYGFYFISLIGRMISGFGDGMISTAISAIIVIEFTEDADFYIGLSNTAQGIGLMLGPVIGLFVYGVLSYANTFYFFTILVLVIGNFSVWLVPKKLDKNQNIQKKDESIREDNVREIEFIRFFKNNRAMMSLFSTFVGEIVFNFLDPILSLALKDKGMKEKNTGLGFAVIALAFAFGAPVAGFTCKFYDRRIVMFSSLLILSVSLMLVGPCQLLQTDKLWVTFVGLSLSGFGLAGIHIPAIAELCASIQEEEDLESTK